MTITRDYSASQARDKLFDIIDHSPERGVQRIHTKRQGAVVISDDEWESLQETLYLMSIPGVSEQIERARRTPFSRCKLVHKG